MITLTNEQITGLSLLYSPVNDFEVHYVENSLVVDWKSKEKMPSKRMMTKTYKEFIENNDK